MNNPDEHPATNAPMLAAVEANMFNVKSAGARVKVTFGQEWVRGGGIVWFSAVTASLSDAMALRDALDATISQAEEQIANRG